jgi:Uma2 family endonuclease
MAHQVKSQLTPPEYLAIERKAEFKSEFYRGEMFAMAGANRRHNRIVTNVASALDLQTKERPCNVYSNDMRVLIPGTGLYTYPDVVVTCGDEQYTDEHQDTLLNPVVIIEVLSDSTEAYDRGRKFEHYQRLESVMEYVLISQTEIRVEKFVRQKDGQWLYSKYGQPDADVKLESIDCHLTLNGVYDKVGPLGDPTLHQL